jgi:hypothetical protein
LAFKNYNELSGKEEKEVKPIFKNAKINNDEVALEVFRNFGKNIWMCLLPVN